MTAEATLLEIEDAARFAELRDSLIERFHPRDAVETDLVDQMVAASWRMRRLWAIHTAATNRDIGNRPIYFDPYATLFDTFDSFSVVFEKLSCLEARFSRIYHKALNALLNLRKDPPRFKWTDSTDSTQFDVILKYVQPKSPPVDRPQPPPVPEDHTPCRPRCQAAPKVASAADS